MTIFHFNAVVVRAASNDRVPDFLEKIARLYRRWLEDPSYKHPHKLDCSGLVAEAIFFHPENNWFILIVGERGGNGTAHHTLTLDDHGRIGVDGNRSSSRLSQDGKTYTYTATNGERIVCDILLKISTEEFVSKYV